ncbi:M56 family metallopeptidase [Pedobacter punctiformis]|uniref:M48 family metalloprotease n=1 Tax=Pedobacter punctiformis TaxID=3004097 RepID=A0ABT4LCR2_9SPHI|nr:M56 family metallopeptidase [Pedobacter sp. HCMS5-2]MCZ4245707.1 M48 family metalloprotease [Pedobacter sp. HCMS5-2]
MENLVQQFIKAFGWSIISSLWQCALIYGVLFILLYSLPKLASKHKHNMAFSSIVLMFICFGYNVGKQMFLYAPKKANGIIIENIETYQYLNNIPQSLSNKAEHYFPIVVAFYIIGIILQLFVILRGYKQLALFKNKYLSEVPAEWTALFEKVTCNLKINKKLRFHLSEIVNVPLVIGYLKPIVLFPVALVNQLDSDQVEAILIHELSHIRRNDFLLNLIKTAIETILFFNPFVWLAGRFIHIEREHSCDDLVLKLTGKPLNYAHALLKLEILKDKNIPAYAMAATGKSQNLYQRIKRITNMKTNYLNTKQQMAALTLGIACLFSIAWINPSEKKKEAIKTIKTYLLNSTAIDDAKTIAYTDTTKKRKVKIITVDANGVKTEYNSIKDMPDSLKINFLDKDFSFNNNFNFNLDSSNFAINFDTAGFAAIHKQFNSPEWKAQMAAIQKNAMEIAKKYNSPEWKANMEKIQKNALDIAQQYNSPEWKANIEKVQKNAEEIAKKYNAPEWKANMEKIQKNALDIAQQYNSAEWKANIEKVQKNAEEIAKKYNSPEWKANIERIEKNAEEITKKYNSPEWKQKIKEMKELQDSPEYQELREKFEKDVQELKEKKEKKEKPEKN